jgi:hypothetical protein
MAINVDAVYKTVLLILNKEQRGYITPDEFNKTATQVQLDIFEQYFDDLNQQLRVPQADFDYSNRQVDLDDKISPFKCFGNCYINSNLKFELPPSDLLTSGTNINYDGNPSANDFSFYRLGTVTYNDIEIQRLQRNEFYNIDKSDLTAPSVNFPVYLYESGKLNIKPSVIDSNVQASFIRKPQNVKWGFTLGTVGQYLYSSSNSINFQLSSSEQVEVITRILFYSGIIIRDPQIIQVAAQEIQQNEINQKS